MQFTLAIGVLSYGDGDDPFRSWIFWHENTATNGENIDATDVTYFNDVKNPQLVTLTTAEGKTVPWETYDAIPQFSDWDFDGDLDIVGIDNFGKYKYFENIGSSTNPQYTEALW